MVLSVYKTNCMDANNDDCHVDFLHQQKTIDCYEDLKFNLVKIIGSSICFASDNNDDSLCNDAEQISIAAQNLLISLEKLMNKTGKYYKNKVIFTD